MSDEQPGGGDHTIVTDVGFATTGDNHMRGYSVDALTGTQRLTSAVAIAVGGRPLDDIEAALLDDIVVASIAPDPRIWPLRLCWLGAVYGNSSAGFAANMLALAGAPFAQATPGGAAQMYLDLEAELGAGLDDDDALAAALASRLSRGERLIGFGLAGPRGTDERVRTSRRAAADRGWTPGRYWTIAHRIELALASDGVGQSLPLNHSGLLGALYLDLGFPVDAHVVPALLCCFPSYVANAVEAARLEPEVLKQLPRDWVEYRGPGPRRSPRAIAADAGKPGGSATN